MAQKAPPHWTPEALVSALTALDVGEVRAREPMSKHTTWGVGGPADAWVQVRDQEALGRLLTYHREAKIPWMVLGNGSNLLVRDGGIAGTVISLKALDRLEILDEAEGRVYAEAGVHMTRLIRLGLAQGFSDVWFLGGIPGTVGGAIRMNAGTRYGEIQQVVASIRVMSAAGRVREVARDALTFNYRSLTLSRNRLVLGATLGFGRGDVAEIRARHREVVGYRTETQPLTQASAGSVFRNPPPDEAGKARSAGQLIDGCGLKGVRVHGAQISEKHANWIVNVGNARAQDILALIRLIREKVKAEHQVVLETEVKIIGRDVAALPPLPDLEYTG